MKTARLLTTTGVSYETRVPPPTIKRWAAEGLIAHQVDSAGRFLFDPSAIEQVKKIRAERPSRRTATA